MLLENLVRFATTAPRLAGSEQDLQEQEAFQGDCAVIHCLEELRLLRDEPPSRDGEA